MAEEKISYCAKNETVCPICRTQFFREQLLSRGRLNAGELSDELYRDYLETQKYGEIYPLVYPVSVCPNCLYAAYASHFDNPGKDDCLQNLQAGFEERKNVVQPIFPNLDFSRNRSLKEGIASYILAALCYQHFPPSKVPTFFIGLSFLRAGWLARNLHTKESGENYNRLAEILLRKAAYFYSQILVNDQNKTEDIESVPYHGPDLDNNYGIDGIYYLQGVLQLKYGSVNNIPERIRSLKAARTAVSRIVGFGKSSKEKPSALLELGRALHKSLKIEMDSLENKT